MSSDSNSSIFKSLVRQGMDGTDTKKKWITYKMVEKAVIDQRIQNIALKATKLSKICKNIAPFGYKQMDSLLKKIKTKMKVDAISDIESEKVSFVSDNENVFSFGKWLALNILLQSIWWQFKQETDSKFGSISSSKSSEVSIQFRAHHKVLAYVTEEAYWTISAQIDEFNEDTINSKVLSKIIGNYITSWF